ncbi:terminase TerL endonuclease subunit [uncultured Flavobacterium sp.]|uniref:terminase large subunit n=1 Tax=uncultured Flavobacterium sp. TaxID=165435 RepID=UPI0025EFC5B6|nr:terminase TerL endonuclease subunit [uncultured Flavobacterium sp.]
MEITPEMESSVPFQYAKDVRSGKIVTGKRIKQAVERFYSWIENADNDGFYIDHAKGMRVINFYPTFLNHTIGKLAGKPFELAPFQQFTMYNLFGWIKKETGYRRIKTVYDKRAKKNGKTAEMAGLALYCLSFDLEMAAQVYVAATKEDQARICWDQARDYIESPVANPKLARMGFYVRQKVIGFHRTRSKMMPLGGDSKTQDGVNCHLGIVDEYHAHPDDSVKENLESSTVQRAQPIIYHITTAGANVQSACKYYEDSVIEVLEGRNIDHRLWIMIHDIDQEDLKEPDEKDMTPEEKAKPRAWENQDLWIKANPLLNNGLSMEALIDEYVKAVNQPKKARNFKTKNLNMWVDQQFSWIYNEDWMKNKVDHIPMEKFEKFGCFGGLDLSKTTDITAYVLVSEPDEEKNRYLKCWFFCPKDTVIKRSREDKVPYQYWVDEGWMIATPGNVIDYSVIEDVIKTTYHEHKVIRLEFDPYNATKLMQDLDTDGFNVSEFSQGIGTISAPTKEFELLVLSERLKHDGNPVLGWMLASCVIYYDANDNMKVHKGRSGANGRRVDGVIATINAIGGSMSDPEESDESIYDKDDTEFVC